MSKLWAELLADMEEEIPAETAEHTKAAGRTAPPSEICREVKKARFHLRISPDLGPLSWVGRLQKALEPVFRKMVQKKKLSIFTACTGTSAVMQGLEAHRQDSYSEC